MPRYAFISPVLATNTGQYRNQVRNLALAIFNHLTPLNSAQEPTSNLEEAERFILKDVLPQVDAYIWVGWHPSVAENVRDRYADLQFESLRQTAFFPPPDPITEAFMIQRLSQKAREHGCEKRWIVRPGDDLTVSSSTDLAARFAPFV